ncbi:hypothetical protein ACFCYH_16070 [Streptomyces sp. NPDC056400]|uniref:hypothetical protein n=1 Tax=Streptomyces sp. NPDC056400 TaxID=3345808 RepID=UPI0035D5C2C4
MAAHWKNSHEVFVLVLRRHGLAPDAIDDVARAWSAFQEFVQVPVDGIEPAEDDGDGFIVQWGRWSWNDDRPALVFTVSAMWRAIPVGSALRLERAD